MRRRWTSVAPALGLSLPLDTQLDIDTRMDTYGKNELSVMGLWLAESDYLALVLRDRTVEGGLLYLVLRPRNYRNFWAGTTVSMDTRVIVWGSFISGMKMLESITSESLFCFDKDFELNRKISKTKSRGRDSVSGPSWGLSYDRSKQWRLEQRNWRYHRCISELPPGYNDKHNLEASHSSWDLRLTDIHVQSQCHRPL